MNPSLVQTKLDFFDILHAGANAWLAQNILIIRLNWNNRKEQIIIFRLLSHTLMHMLLGNMKCTKTKSFSKFASKIIFSCMASINLCKLYLTYTVYVSQNIAFLLMIIQRTTRLINRRTYQLLIFVSRKLKAIDLFWVFLARRSSNQNTHKESSFGAKSQLHATNN